MTQQVKIHKGNTCKLPASAFSAVGTTHARGFFLVVQRWHPQTLVALNAVHNNKPTPNGKHIQTLSFHESPRTIKQKLWQMHHVLMLLQRHSSAELTVTVVPRNLTLVQHKSILKNFYIGTCIKREPHVSIDILFVIDIPIESKPCEQVNSLLCLTASVRNSPTVQVQIHSQ